MTKNKCNRLQGHATQSLGEELNILTTEDFKENKTEGARGWGTRSTCREASTCVSQTLCDRRSPESALPALNPAGREGHSGFQVSFEH